MIKVRFDNGKFGIRRKRLFCKEHFKDLKSGNFWWSVADSFYADCQGSEEDVDEIFNGAKYKEVK